MFSLKSPSLLAFGQERTEGNLETIYGIERAPCDTYMREVLDPISPESLRPSFKGVFGQLQRGKALEAMTFLDGHYLVALDGTGYFSSKTIHCASCLQKQHRNGSTTYYHQMLGAAIIHPDMREVIPLMPEPIVKQDGTEKNDCERETVASQELVTPDKRRDPASKVRLKLAIRSWTILMTLGTDSGQTTPKTLATSVIEDMRGLGSCGSRCHVIARRDYLAQS